MKYVIALGLLASCTESTFDRMTYVSASVPGPFRAGQVVVVNSGFYRDCTGKVQSQVSHYRDRDEPEQAKYEVRLTACESGPFEKDIVGLASGFRTAF